MARDRDPETQRTQETQEMAKAQRLTEQKVDQTNRQIHEIFRAALQKGYLNHGFMGLVAESLTEGRPGPLTLEEFHTLSQNMRKALKVHQPTWAEQYTDCTCVEIVVQLACLYVYDA
jgi:hypothetical protein